MKEIESMLYEHNFRRCSSGCLVNLKHVNGYQGNEISVLGRTISKMEG